MNILNSGDIILSANAANATAINVTTGIMRIYLYSRGPVGDDIRDLSD
jgi:hypothetical protein